MHWKFLVSQGLYSDCIQTAITKHREVGGSSVTARFPHRKLYSSNNCFVIKIQKEEANNTKTKKGLAKYANRFM